MTKEFRKRKNETLLQKTTLTENVVMEDCENCTLVDVVFDGRKSSNKQKLLDARNCKNCKFIKLEFYGKSNEGLCFNLTGEDADSNEIIDLYIHDIKSDAKNGCEPLRIGNSDISHCWLRTLVLRPRFENILTEEPELISIKSCGNVIDGGSDTNPDIINVKNCTSLIRVRHGHTNEIKNLNFEGIGGIGVHGKNNKVENCEHRNNKSTEFKPLEIRNGNKEEDPNEVAKIPVGKEAPKGHAIYQQVKNGYVTNCRYINCTVAITFGEGKGDYKPIGFKVIENYFECNDGKSMTAVLADNGAKVKDQIFEGNMYKGKMVIPESISSAFAKGDSQQPDPIVVPDPPEEPIKPDAPKEEAPVGPEPIPIVEPAEKPPKHGHTCQICGKEDSKGRYSVYVCLDDMGEDIEREFNRAWGEAEERIKAARKKKEEE